MNKIILAFDSFKGSLTSREVADAFAAGLATSALRCEVCKAVIADGGEGTVEALCDALGGEYVSVAVADPLGRKVMARYAIVDGGATA
ncbi:MAG: glycerate kinase, partial [Bacteroidaceae bacterium]|nr:glycerate kinase [Bacteroidaceae bacterium]